HPGATSPASQPRAGCRRCPRRVDRPYERYRGRSTSLLALDRGRPDRCAVERPDIRGACGAIGGVAVHDEVACAEEVAHRFVLPGRNVHAPERLGAALLSHLHQVGEEGVFDLPSHDATTHEERIDLPYRRVDFAKNAYADEAHISVPVTQP